MVDLRYQDAVEEEPVGNYEVESESIDDEEDPADERPRVKDNWVGNQRVAIEPARKERWRINEENRAIEAAKEATLIWKNKLLE